MACIAFYVTRRVGKWFVDVGNETHGPYLSERDALADAIHAAEITAGQRRATAVFRKPPKGPAETVWTSTPRRPAAAPPAPVTGEAPAPVQP